MRFENKVAIVTGAATGIGRATALRLAKEGADLVIADINVEAANQVVKEIIAMGRKAIAVNCDVTDFGQASAMGKTGLDTFKKVDILVNNAGGGATSIGLLSQLDRKRWDIGINLNLGGTFNCTRAVINHMMERRSGKIVNLASAAGIIGAPSLTAYSAAKAGIVGFTMALAKEVVEYGINVNCIAPGPTLTHYGGADDNRPEELKKKLLDSTGFGRRSKPEEVAAAIAFLASDDAGFITGQTLNVGGLRTLGRD